MDGVGKADMGKLEGGQEFAERHSINAFEVSESESEEVLGHDRVSSAKRRAGLRRV
jgi:hypothetical protein